MAGLVWKRVMDSTQNYSSNSIESESSRNPGVKHSYFAKFVSNHLRHV